MNDIQNAMEALIAENSEATYFSIIHPDVWCEMRQGVTRYNSSLWWRIWYHLTAPFWWLWYTLTRGPDDPNP